MDLLTLVRRRLIVPGLEASSKFAAIRALIDVLVAEGEIPKERRAVVLNAVNDREHERPTGLGRGLALPHGVVDFLDREVAVLGLSKAGLDFGALDGMPAKVIILLVTPRSLAHRHPTNVQKIALLALDDDFRESLASCETVEEAVALVSATLVALGLPDPTAPDEA